MDTAKSISVTIVNKNYPPKPGITGESANELAAYLISKGFDVYVVHTEAAYGAAKTNSQPAGKLIKARSIYNGKKRLIRLFSSFIESYFLVRAAIKKGKGLIITMTDPPFLIFWSAVLLKKHTWAYWSMDLYPEAFEAAHLAGKNSFLYGIFKRAVLKNPPHYLISLGRLQYDFLTKDYNRNIPGVALPCGILEANNAGAQMPQWRTDTSRIYYGYCGNLGEAHSQEFVEEVIRQLDPKKHRFILSVYGAKAKGLEEFAAGYEVVQKVPSVAKNQLSFIDVHLVTLQKNWNHICVPSKAVTAVCTGAPILFCGTRDNDNWAYLQDAGWFIDETRPLQQQVQHVLAEITPEAIGRKRFEARNLSSELVQLKQQAFEAIEDFASGEKATVEKQELLV